MNTAVYKQLATMQDLALGSGKVIQQRNGKDIELDKIDINSFSVSAIEELRTIVGNLTTKRRVIKTGYYEVGDGGGGQYSVWVALPGLVDNGGSIIVPGGVIGDVSTVGAWVFNDLSYATVESFGAIGLDAIDQNIDHSESFQQLFNANIPNVFASSGKFMIDAETIRPGNLKEGVGIRSNTNIKMANDTYIHALDTDYVQTNTFYFYLEENLSWIGGNLVGDLDARTIFGPAFNGIGFRVQGSNNVTTRDVMFEKHYTDGYAVVYNDADIILNAECENVHFLNCSAERNYRNGASIIGCRKGSIIGGSYSGNGGTLPGAGVDVEPNTLKPNGNPAVVDDFEVSVVANSNIVQGIVADARGIIKRLTLTDCKTLNNGSVGMWVGGVEDSVVANNIAIANGDVDIVTNKNINTVVENNIETITPSSPTPKLITKANRQGLSAVASGVLGGIKIPAIDLNANFGTGNFTMLLEQSLPDWTPVAELTIYSKVYGSDPYTGLIITIHPLGNIKLYMYRNDSGTTFSGAFFNPGMANEPLLIGISVTRETIATDGSIDIYFNGRFSESIVIPAATTVSLDNSAIGYIGGNSTALNEATLYSYTAYNYMLTAADHKLYYDLGITAANKWGSQSPLVFGCIMALESEGIQPVPGQWLDSSDNKVHCSQPDGALELLVDDKTFELRGITTWEGTNESQWLNGFNQDILPVNSYIEKIVGAVTGADIQDVSLDDGQTPNHYVVLTVGLTAGVKTFTINNPDTDLVHYKIEATPDVPATMTIAWTITGIILDY